MGHAYVRNMSCCEDAETRAQVRRCSGLVESLLRVTRVAAATGLADTKAVENCTSALRNLCFGLREGPKPLSGGLFSTILRGNRFSKEGKQKGVLAIIEGGIYSHRFRPKFKNTLGAPTENFSSSQALDIFFKKNNQ